ncbi:hypothetical protein [Embleya sp. NPDC001921]
MALNTFFRGSAFTQALSAIGDVHFAAALSAMKSRPDSPEREANVREARTHLRAAHVAYRQYWASERRQALLRGSKGILSLPFTLAQEKDANACRLLCYTYAYFADWESALEWLDKEEKARATPQPVGLLTVLRADAFARLVRLKNRIHLPPLADDRQNLLALRAAG